MRINQSNKSTGGGCRSPAWSFSQHRKGGDLIEPVPTLSTETKPLSRFPPKCRPFRGLMHQPRSLLGILGLLQKRFDLGRECPAGFLLVVGKLGQRGRLAQTGQVGVDFPVL